MHKHTSPFPASLSHTRSRKKTTHSIFPYWNPNTHPNTKWTWLQQHKEYRKHKCTLLTSPHYLWSFEKKIGPCFLSKYLYIQPWKLLITYTTSGKLRQKPKKWWVNKSEQKCWPGSQGTDSVLFLCWWTSRVSYTHPRVSTLVPVSEEPADSLCVASHPVVWSLPER